MFHIKPYIHYYGSNIRTVKYGTGIDGIIILEYANTVAGGWIKYAEYYESDASTYTDIMIGVGAAQKLLDAQTIQPRKNINV
jgi:hypothetical protein